MSDEGFLTHGTRIGLENSEPCSWTESPRPSLEGHPVYSIDRSRLGTMPSPGKNSAEWQWGQVATAYILKKKPPEELGRV